MLALWPLITIALYRKKSVTEATLWAVLGGYMFLPARMNVDLPLIPSLDKHSTASLSAFFVCRFMLGKRIPIWNSNKPLTLLLLLFIIGPFFTAEFNGDPVYVSGTFLPALTHYDALSAVIKQFIILLPFFMGKALFKTYEDQLVLFKVLIIAGLIYSVFIVYEVRMSPQLHKMVYGFFSHSFGQQKRFGGFRPMVFMSHGLWVAIFMVATVVSAATLLHLKIKAWKLSASNTAYYLLLILILCKSAGSIIYAAISFPLIRFGLLRIQLWVSMLLLMAVLSYPILSLMNAIPYDSIVKIAMDFNPERAQSLEFRFKNEQILLSHARERIVWGWGGWNRNRVFNEDTGENETVTDGLWIITVGIYGLVGFVAQFGLIVTPVFNAIASIKRIAVDKEKSLMAGHALLIALLSVDQIPNATLEPWMWLIIGILSGRTESIISAYNLNKPLRK